MKKFMIALSLLIAGSTANAGDIRDLIKTFYDMDMIKPTERTQIDLGTLISGEKSRFADFQQANICEATTHKSEPQDMGEVSDSGTASNVAADLTVLLGLTAEQAKAVSSFDLELKNVGMFAAPSDERLESLQKQKAAGCQLVKKGSLQVVSVMTAKLKLSVQFNSGKVNLDKVASHILDYLGNGVSVRYSTNTGKLNVELAQPIAIGINLRAIDSNHMALLN